MKLKNIKKSIIFISIITLFTSGIFVSPVFASTTDGTIDSASKYAWSENLGWLNFAVDGGNIHITDASLTGYIWSENAGWIILNPSTSGVINDGNGNLSGYAWGENIGWIDFNPTGGGVIINSSGEFLGYAYGENAGWIVFNCSTTSSCSTVDYKVKTDWRPASSRTVSVPSGGVSTYSFTTNIPPITPNPSSAPIEEQIKKIPENIASISEAMPEIIKKIPKKIKEFFIPKQKEKSPELLPIEKIVKKEAPLALRTKWQLLPAKPIRDFVLAPLPKEIRELAQKFPELAETFKKVGITKITDIEKLKNVGLTLPGLTARANLPMVKVGPGKFALPKGVPIAKLSNTAKQQLPAEIVFAKTGGQMIDFNIALSISEKGEPQQKISTISGSPLELAVKPDKPVKSVKGYIVFKSKKSQPTSFQLPLNSLLASLVFANPVFAKPQEKPVETEEKLVLLEFEYTDTDGDGIYTAEIEAPIIEGEYEILTVMDFKDSKLGKKEIRLTTVVDPEGYIYEKDGEKETRIPGAIVSIYWLNPQNKQYELWPAKEYNQENPQTTDVRGTYSFLVPEGFYYLKVETPGYLAYDGKPFQVKEGSGVHINIELKTKYWWLKIVDWKTIFLVLIVVLLFYNFYRDKLREKLLRK